MPFTNYFDIDPEETENFRSAKRHLLSDVIDTVQRVSRRPSSIQTFGPHNLVPAFRGYALEILLRVAGRLRRSQSIDCCASIKIILESVSLWHYAPRRAATEWLWEKFVPQLCAAISAPHGLWNRIVEHVLSSIDLKTIHPSSATYDVFLRYDCANEIYSAVEHFAYLELKDAFDSDIQIILRATVPKHPRIDQDRAVYEPNSSRDDSGLGSPASSKDRSSDEERARSGPDRDEGSEEEREKECFGMPEPNPLGMSDKTRLSTKRLATVQPLLHAKGWTINKWASKAGIGKNSAYEYLKGKRGLSPSNRRAMAEELGIKPEELPE